MATSGRQAAVAHGSGHGLNPLGGPGLVATRSRVQANGLTMSYLEWSGPGDSRGAPTVLLHSALQQGEGMANLASHLARNGRVIVPDLRGRGETEQPVDGYDAETMADDVLALIDAIGVVKPVIIGRLHGGQVAYHLASRHPERVRGLVIGGTMPEIDQARSQRMVEGVRALPRRFGSYDAALVFYQERLRLSEERARHDIPHDLELRGADYVWRHNLDIVEQIARQSTPRDDWDLLRTVTCPVLVLRGQLGSITDHVADRYRECLPQCAIQTVLGAGHDVLLGNGAEQSFGAIDVFLVRLSDRGVASTNERPAGGPREIPTQVVRSLNTRDALALSALCLEDVAVTFIGARDQTRSNGAGEILEMAKRIFAQMPNALVDALNIVTEGETIAFVLSIAPNMQWRTVPEEELDDRTAILAPIWMTIRDGKISELTVFHLRIP